MNRQESIFREDAFVVHYRDVIFTRLSAFLRTSPCFLLHFARGIVSALCLFASPADARETIAGDVAPWGNPDGELNVGDLVVANRMLQGLIVPTQEELLTCDVAPSGAPDGMLIAGDMTLLTRAVMGLIVLQPVLLPPLAPFIGGSPGAQGYTVSGTAAPDQRINLYLNGNLQTVVRSDSTGNFSVVVSLSPGENQIYATAEDDAGESPASNTVDASLTQTAAVNPVDVSKISRLDNKEDKQNNNIESIYIKTDAGSVEAYAWVSVMTGKGKSITVQADQDGKFEAYVPGRLSDGVSIFVSDTLGSISEPVTLQNQTVGALTGEFKVNRSGAATFSIPISVPPGTAGMQPNIAFTYSSQGGNGLLGQGWVLSGLSAVQRCPRVIAIDGVRGGVNLDADDRFCLDGQRLIAVSGVYGADGTEYRTEKETFARIRSYGSDAADPDYFIVETKSGQTVSYGTTADSRIEAVGTDTAVMWAVRRIEDTPGNYIAFNYYENPVTGESYPTRIDYTGNATAGMAPYNSVRFVYETRPDVYSGYIAGSPATSTQRLTDIQAWADDTIVREYRVDYRSAVDYKKPYSMLERIKQCDGDGNEASCLKPLNIGWTTDLDNITSTARGVSNSWNNSGYTFVGDFNGDGLADIASADGADVYMKLYNSTFGSSGDTFISETWTLPNADEWGVSEKTLVGDFNGDGLSDIVSVGNLIYPYAYMKLSTGDGFVAASWNAPMILGKFHVADVNGDGLSDLISESSSSSGGSVRAMLSTGSGFQAQPASTTVTYTSSPTDTKIGDFNGDGLTDVAHYDHTEVHMYFGHADGFTTATWPVADDWGNTGRTWAADFNGDGKTDIASQSGSNVYMKLSTGTGFVSTTWVSTANWSGDAYNIWIGDFNRDGRADFATRYNSMLYIKYSTGAGWNEQSYSVANSWSGIGYNFVQDFNGDGRSDIASADGDTIHMKAFNAGTERLVNSIDNGMGIDIRITYDLATNDAVYTKHHTGAWPDIDVQLPIPVVLSNKTANGIGGRHTVNYTYEGARINTIGRGFLGFEKVTADNPGTGIRTETIYRQDYPYAGMVADARHFLNDGLVSAVTNTYDEVLQATSGGDIHFVRVRQTTEDTYELPGQGPANENLTTSVVTDNSYDDYGNPLTIDVVTADAAGNQYTRLTANTYDNDIPNWHLGRLKTAQVTATTPADPTGLTRLSSFDYYADSGLLFHEAIESNNPTGPPDSPLKSVTTHEYDTFGNKTRVLTTAYQGYDSSTGTQARETSSVYDARGQFPQITTNALGHTETYTYDARFGMVKTLTGPNNLTTSWEYDGFGRKIKETRADNTQTTWAFAWCGDACPRGGYQTVTRATGAPRAVLYEDKLGREVRKETVGFDGTPVYKDTEYNAIGQISRASRNYFSTAVPQWTYFYYDGLERLIKQSEPDGGITHFVHKGLEQIIVQTNITALTVDASNIPASNRIDSIGSAEYTLVTVRENNAIGKPVKITDPDMHRTRYEYDVFENLTRVTDANDNVTVMEYDLRGRKRSMDDPDMGYWAYRYNGFGELVWQRDARLQVTRMQYDALGRMTSRTDLADTPEAATDFRGYDSAEHGIGKPDTVLGADGYVRSHYYDSFGRPTRIDTLIAGEIYRQDTTYDGYGRVDTTIYPTGFAVRNTYTALGYRHAVVNADDPAVVYWTNEAVNAEGQITRERLGNNLTTVNSYNPADGHLQGITTGIGAASDVQSLAYTFDALGNLLQRRDQIDSNSPITEDFTYDTINRLRTGYLQSIGSSGSYDYDAVGNIRSKSGFAGQYIYGENSAGPHAVTTVKNGSTVVAGYTYDANGNMTGGAGRNLTYTAFNLPSRISKDGKDTDFEYDPDRARTRRIDEQGATVYLNPRIDLGNHYEKETHADGSVEHKHYIYGGSSPIAIYTERSDSETDIKYLHRDHLGSIDVITDGAGNVLQRLSFGAFGERRAAATWTLPLPVGFIALSHHGYTGHEHLDDLGLVHMNGRLYDPQLGRFLQADPTVQFPESTQGMNRYTYAGNNPLSYTDPSGYSWLSKVWKKIKNWVKVIVAVVVAIYTFGVVAAYLNGLFLWGGTVTAGIIAGAAAGFVSGLILSGGDLKVAFSSALGGAITGGVTGAFGNTWSLARVGTTSVAGGVSSEVTGGKFKDGFRFALAVSMTTYTALRMRQEMIEQSKLDPSGVNASGKSVGFKGDKFKLGGGRFDFDRPSIESPLGGQQGGVGYMGIPFTDIGYHYAPGSFTDYLVEAFAGPHDYLNSFYWYDKMGNIPMNMSMAARGFGEMLSLANIALASPFVAASVVPEYTYPALEHLHNDTRR